MTSLLHVVLILSALAALLLEVRLGALGSAVPAVGLVVVLLAARHSPPTRVRWMAIWCGFIVGLGLEGGFLIGPMVFLVLAGLALGMRHLFRLEHVAAKMVYVLGFVGVEALALRAFRAPILETTLPLPEVTAALAGFLMAAVLYVGLELCFERSFLWRHALERP